ncbi:complex III assembly factor LYRM7 [Drosophila nasuta]|uniref:Complex III assembly factor LYRM7 n=1 Tax=Drosophila albomicans TaxID=7291 RepID=A0A6P8XWN9_DROAB|nr:complex III assembly factor LYRM7 [Drosophila albomicans]XP_060649352.1 complex III assembly factor LYRM7 [Drosophila nasuta]
MSHTMSQPLKHQVLSVFKKLHRTRQYVFHGDNRALLEGRHKINDSFRQNRSESNVEEIQKMIKLAIDVDHELRTNIIQAEKRKDDVYELRITPETTRLDNVVFNPDAVIEPPRRRKGDRTSNCCGGAAMAALEAEKK